MTTATEQHRTPLGLFADKPVPRHYDRIVDVPRVRHYSRRTEEAYLYWIRRYIEFHDHQHPRQLAEGDVNRFLTHLAVNERVAASTRNQALSAVLFLCEHALEQPLDRIEGVVRARRPKRLPAVLTVDEFSKVMSHLTEDKWLIAMLPYGDGLRLLEALRLRIRDLDFERGESTVGGGKGDKDRVTTMPKAVIRRRHEHLRRIEAVHRQDLADGYDIRTVQELLGHRDVRTTMIYTHVLNRGGRGVRIPADYHAMTTEEFRQVIDLKRITADTELRVRLTALRSTGNTVTILKQVMPKDSMRPFLLQARRSVNKHRLRRFCYLVVSISLLGCSGNSQPDAEAMGKAIGKNVTEFAQGVGSGVDTQLQVTIELSPELTKAGLSHTIAKQKTSLDDTQKAISIYFLSAQALNCTLTAKAYNADNQEIGRAASDVQFVQDDAQYIAFTFPPDMDRQTVKVYKITARFPEAESAQ